jgi:uncharacterized protein YecE (DUF72 family)
MTLLVGTSGWSYPEWRGTHYPAGLPQRQQLPYLAGRLRTVELNASFYATQRLTSVAVQLYPNGAMRSAHSS